MPSINSSKLDEAENNLPTFESLLLQHLARGPISQKMLSAKSAVDNGLISKIMYDNIGFRTSRTRRYVRDIIRALKEAKLLNTLEEANKLMESIPTFGKLDTRDDEERQLIEELFGNIHADIKSGSEQLEVVLNKPNYNTIIKKRDYKKELLEDYILDTRNNAQMRLKAFEVYCSFGYKNIDIFRGLATDFDENVREHIAESLTRYNIPFDVDSLKSLLLDRSSLIGRKAVASIKQLLLDERIDSDFLGYAAERKNAYTRNGAIIAIIELDAPNSVDLLGKFAGTHYQESRDAICEYFARLLDEGRLNSGKLEKAICLLQQYLDDGYSKPLTEKLLRETLAKLYTVSNAQQL